MSKLNTKIIEDKTTLQVGKISCNLLHDLTNPITGLSLYLENIQDKTLRNQLEEILEINAEIIQFIKTVQETVEKPNYISTFDLSSHIRNAIFLGRHKAKNKNVRVVYVSNVNNVKIKANKLQIYQIIMNLVGNGIDSFEGYISGKRNTVTVTLSRLKDNLRISVSDNGCGIKDTNKIFDMGYTTKKQGLGIGLSTVKDIVNNNLRGQIYVKSKLNQGTKFHVLIPNEIVKY